MKRNIDKLMNRRHFVKRTLTAALATPALGWARSSEPHNLDVRITRVCAIENTYRRPRIIAGNSGYKLSGGVRKDYVMLLFGDNGKIGIGHQPKWSRPKPTDYPLGKTVGELLGKDRELTASTVSTTAVWDLAGKTIGKPVYELLGGKEHPEGIQVYDGSIYMEELVNRDEGSAYRNPGAPYGKNPDWKDIFAEAIDRSSEQGHNFVKVKIGRGHLHLSRKAGNLQDAAVLQFIREYGGPELKIGIDANNGYRLEDTLWLLEECGDVGIEFIEEMFPEDIGKYRIVKDKIRELGLKTLIADGESWMHPHDPGIPEFIRSGVIDLLQGDMQLFQIEGILEEARMAREAGHGGLIAPHNWGREYPFYVMIHMGYAIPNYYGAEHDPGVQMDPILHHDGYTIKDGRCHAPASPGFGVSLDLKKLERREKIFDFKA